MLDSIKDKTSLPLIYAGAVLILSFVGMFLFFGITPSWERLLPAILAVSGFAGGFALTFVPIFKNRKFIPVICITVAAVVTGVIVVIL